jgi:hypothetical protein
MENTAGLTFAVNHGRAGKHSGHRTKHQVSYQTYRDMYCEDTFEAKFKFTSQYCMN